MDTTEIVQILAKRPRMELVIETPGGESFSPPRGLVAKHEMTSPNKLTHYYADDARKQELEARGYTARKLAEPIFVLVE